jgi:hypothetical protein
VGLGAVYTREIDGEILTLSASGWLYDQTFVLYDYETETVWYHLPGTDGLTGVGGFYAGRFLQEFESTITRWDRWKESHPDSEFLKYP